MRNPLSRWLGALLALSMLGVSATALADDGHHGRGGPGSQYQFQFGSGAPGSQFLQAGGGPGGPGRSRGNAQCTQLAAALQIAPNTVYYPGPLAAAQRCGLPVQQASTPPACGNLAQAAQTDPSLHRFADVNKQLRQCLVQGTIQPVNAANQFSDLGGYSWALSDINQLVTLGIFRGVGGGRFAPAGHLTRAQFAALMVRVFNLTQPATPVTFSDVPTTFWAYADIEAAAPYMSTFAGISGGTPAFEPSLDVTRIEVAATIGKIMNTINPSGNPLPSLTAAEATFGTFSDASQVPQGLEQYAAIAVTLGFMKGYPNGSFGVNDSLTRAEAAVLLDRVLRTTETMSNTTPPSGNTTTATGTFVSYSATQIALSSGTYNLGTSFTVELNGQSEGSGVSALAVLNTADTVTLTLVNGDVTDVSATNSSATTATGTFVSYSATQIMLSSGTYNLGTSFTVELNGQSEGSGVSALAVLNTADTVTLTLVNGDVTAVSATNSSATTATGTFETYTDTQIVLSSGTYNLGASFTVELNGQSEGSGVSALAALSTADTVTLTLVNDEVTNVDATSAGTTSTVTGTFDSYSGSTITVTVNGSMENETLAGTYTVYLNNVSSNLSDLVSGDSVTLTLTGGYVTEVQATASTTTTATGYVVYVPSTVSMTVYGASGLQVETATSTVTVTVSDNGSGAGNQLTTALIGDNATVSLTNGAMTVSATPSSNAQTGILESLVDNAGTWTLTFTSGAQMSFGSVEPTLIEGGTVVSSIGANTQVTVVPDAVNGAALVIAQ